ncbi:MAG: helix-turn-helix domain-containing protein [Magnetococcus sp. YQC-5]
MLIGQLARLSGGKVQTIRYYEQIGLLPHAHRSSGNQRLYTSDHLERVLFIRHCREFGFSLEQIRELLQLGGEQERSCAQIDQIARQRLEEVKHKIQRLECLKSELERIISSCHGGPTYACRIIQSLSDHAQCLVADHGAMESSAAGWSEKGG